MCVFFFFTSSRIFHVTDVHQPKILTAPHPWCWCLFSVIMELGWALLQNGGLSPLLSAPCSILWMMTLLVSHLGCSIFQMSLQVRSGWTASTPTNASLPHSYAHINVPWTQELAYNRSVVQESRLFIFWWGTQTLCFFKPSKKKMSQKESWELQVRQLYYLCDRGQNTQPLWASIS